MPDTIINWLFRLVKTIPEDIIKTLILGFLILVLRILVDKIKFLNSKFKNLMVMIFSTNIEISTKTFLSILQNIIMFQKEKRNMYTVKIRVIMMYGELLL